MTTLRWHLEQQIAELDYAFSRDTGAEIRVLKLLQEHALESLAILDAAKRLAHQCPPTWSEPNEHGQSVITAGPYVASGYRLVRDPEPT